MKKPTAKQQLLWNKKLKKSGFVDIEDSKGYLKEYDSRYFQDRYHPESFVNKERYYQLAGQLIHSYPFLNVREKKVWTMHAEGTSQEVIATKMKVDQATISRIVTRIARWVKA